MAAPCLYQARHVMLGRNHYMRRDESLTDSKLQSHLFGHGVIRVTGMEKHNLIKNSNQKTFQNQTNDL